MTPDMWHTLLHRLDVRTRDRSIEWTPTDRHGSFVSAYAAGSVTIRGVPVSVTSAIPTIANLMGSTARAEIRDRDGIVVAQLGGSPNFATAAGEEARETMLDNPLTVAVDQLAQAIAAAHTTGDEVARAILDELG